MNNTYMYKVYKWSSMLKCLVSTQDPVPITFGIALFGGNWTHTKPARAEETQSRHDHVP